MKTRLIVFTILLVNALCASAQKYVVDVLFSDSIQAYTIEPAKSGGEVPGTAAFKIANGEELTLTRVLEGNPGRGVIVRDDKEYCIDGDLLVLSEDNPAGTVGLFPDLRQDGKHTAIEHFFTTITPYIIISILFVAAILLLFLGRIELLRRPALLLVPLCILLASALEIWAYATLGGDVFWWCDYDTYGFWGSALRAIPFVIFVVAQVFSIKLYERLLFGEHSDKEISIKPMAISMGACIPLTLIAVFAGAVWWRSANEVVAAIVFLASFGIGTFISWKRNVSTAGKVNGSLLTLFIAVYIIGVIIAAVGLITILLRLILQILLILAGIAAILFVGGSAAGGGGGGGGSSKTVWYDAEGGCHNSEIDARMANERIAERKAGL
ncbi:MAG: hypothetical protein C7K11_06490 [Candidatus Amulumruptor caecigallinarius]|uniref:Uncharacterized protein n=1 Tax=Candidatus Amulumruptor caecigallinarius TaxID=2109911 RepID=A0A4Q0U8F3_9BACT|nr:MAG: hypothetical protein C7K11_06490 [Candidatus Amulumruptor caecigallinarius]HJE38881.1 hypothetical protein [Candidatus Amulumruptor caecigallinarius]